MSLNKNIVVCMMFVLLLQESANASNLNAYQYYNTGIQFYKNGKINDAIQAFSYAIRIAPNFADAHYNLGTIYLKQGDLNSASAEFTKVLRINPHDHEAQKSLSSIDQASKLPMENKKTALVRDGIDPSIEYDDKAIAYIPPKKTKISATKMQIKAKLPLRTVYTGLDNPTGLTADLQNNIYVASYADNSITKITPEGKREKILTRSVDGPVGLAIDSSNNLYIASYNNGKVILMTSAGEESIVSSGLDKPYGLLIHNKKLYISEQGTDNVTSIVLK